MDVHAALAQFEDTFKHQVAQILHHARGSAPGGVGGDWAEVVAHFGLPAKSNAERSQLAGQAGHARGALPDEVAAVLGVLSQQAEQVLTNMGHAFGPALAADPTAAARLQELAGKVQSMPTEQRKVYTDETKPKAGTGIAGLFANAAATSKLTPWANLKYDSHFTLSCPGCGSPQRQRLIFNCEYCGASLFGAD